MSANYLPCTELGAVRRMVAREEDTIQIFKEPESGTEGQAQNVVIFFLSQQVMFAIMKIPNVRFSSSPSNNIKMGQFF